MTTSLPPLPLPLPVRLFRDAMQRQLPLDAYATALAISGEELRMLLTAQTHQVAPETFDRIATAYEQDVRQVRAALTPTVGAETFSSWLGRQMEGVTQTSLRARTQIAAPLLRAFVSGKALPDSDQAERLARALYVDRGEMARVIVADMVRRVEQKAEAPSRRPKAPEPPPTAARPEAAPPEAAAADTSRRRKRPMPDAGAETAPPEAAAADTPRRRKRPAPAGAETSPAPAPAPAPAVTPAARPPAQEAVAPAADQPLQTAEVDPRPAGRRPRTASVPPAAPPAEAQEAPPEPPSSAAEQEPASPRRSRRRAQVVGDAPAAAPVDAPAPEAPPPEETPPEAGAAPPSPQKSRRRAAAGNVTPAAAVRAERDVARESAGDSQGSGASGASPEQDQAQGVIERLPVEPPPAVAADVVSGETRLSLSPDEARLVRLWRRLHPHGRRATLQYIGSLLAEE